MASKAWAFVGVFFTIIGFLLVYLFKKDDKYAMHYAKQGLVVFITSIVVFIAQVILAFVPVIGGIIVTILSIGLFILWIIGLVNVFSGEMKFIPLIGKFAK